MAATVPPESIGGGKWCYVRVCVWSPHQNGCPWQQRSFLNRLGEANCVTCVCVCALSTHQILGVGCCYYPHHIMHNGKVQQYVASKDLISSGNLLVDMTRRTKQGTHLHELGCMTRWWTNQIPVSHRTECSLQDTRMYVRVGSIVRACILKQILALCSTRHQDSI